MAGTRKLTLFSTYAFAYADLTKNCLQYEVVAFSDQSIATTVPNNNVLLFIICVGVLAQFLLADFRIFEKLPLKTPSIK